jgi:SpoIID/LytB domain protein
MRRILSIFVVGFLLLGLLPKQIEAAESTEPELQVKLVNYLGNQTSISVKVSGNYLLDGTSKKLSSAKTYKVKVEQSKVSLYDGSTRLILSDKISITPEKSTYRASINSREYYGSFSFINESGYVRPINKIYIEDYLKSVVPAEMYASWNKEALKAQAVAARTYAYYRLGKVINDTTSYQVYSGADRHHANSTAAVEETAGQILTYNGSAIDALFSASNGGMSESNHNEFGSPALPYFPIQRDDYDKKIAWNVSIQKQQINIAGLDLKNPNAWWGSTTEKDGNFTAKIKTWLNQNGYSNKQIKIVSISKLSFYDKTESGRVSRGDLGFTFLVRDKFDSTGKLALQNGSLNYVIADKIRSFIGMSVMSSTLITATNETSTAFSFSGLGNGHGVGMSQHGANNRVNAGHKYQNVLAFYYPGTKLVKQYERHKEDSAVSYTPIKNQLNGKDFRDGYFGNSTTYVHWSALRTLSISYTHKGYGLFVIEGRNVQAKAINGEWYIHWSQFAPGKITYKTLAGGGFNFIYTTPAKIQLDGIDFAKGGYLQNDTTYLHWSALNTLKIPFTNKGNGLFVIEGRTVQTVKINGEWYIHWSHMAPGKISYEIINGGYNFIYGTPLNIQFNGNNFAKGGYKKNTTTYIHYSALSTLNIPYTNKGNGLFTINGRSVQSIAINGDWYIHWSQLAPGKITYKVITGGYNFIYTP